jgi:hypothetical protein
MLLALIKETRGSPPRGGRTIEPSLGPCQTSIRAAEGAPYPKLDPRAKRGIDASPGPVFKTDQTFADDVSFSIAVLKSRPKRSVGTRGEQA